MKAVFRMLPVLVAVAVPFVSRAVSPALMSVSDGAAARAAVYDYTNNVLRIEVADAKEWDDGNPKRPLDLFPANLPYHLVVGSAPEDRQAAERAVETVKTSMPPDLYRYFTERKVLAPLIQRIFRRCRPGVSGGQDYVSEVAHPTVWRAKDFDLTRIAACAAQLTSNDVPVIVFIEPVYEEYEADPLTRAVPIADYPDPRPEESVVTPFGVGIVLRAMESRRKFRFRATAWPADPADVAFYWTSYPARRVGISGYLRDERLVPQRGYAEIKLSWHGIGNRADVAVFAARRDGPPGPPSIISFTRVPNESRTYDRQGRITEVRYTAATVPNPALFSDKLWTDEYEYDAVGHPTGFSRTRKGRFGIERFSVEGEFLEETYANESPKVTRKVRYFTPPDRPETLQYEILPELFNHPMRPLSLLR